MIPMVYWLLAAALILASFGIVAVHYKLHPGWVISVASVLIAIGGAIATFGWNEISSKETRLSLDESRRADTESKRRALTRAVAAEFLTNLVIINDKAYTETNEEELSKLAIYPRFQTTVLSAFLASGLFVGEEDRLLFTMITELHSRMTDANERLSMSMLKMSLEPKSLIPSGRKAINASVVRRDLQKRLRALGTLLLDKYGIDRNESFFVDLDSRAQKPNQ
jgi:hypothetical protein